MTMFVQHIKSYLGSNRLFTTMKLINRLMKNTINNENKPFNVLKIVFQNGTEKIPDLTVKQMWNWIGKDDIIILNTDDSEVFQKAQKFYDQLTQQNDDSKNNQWVPPMEGVVIKPNIQPDYDCVPYIKVRHPKYLTLVYGYDDKFPHKYARLLRQKSWTTNA